MSVRQNNIRVIFITLLILAGAIFLASLIIGQTPNFSLAFIFFALVWVPWAAADYFILLPQRRRKEG